MIHKESVRLLTRKDIIELWLKQPTEALDTFCCPNCRDLLRATEEGHYCSNCDIMWLTDPKGTINET